MEDESLLTGVGVRRMAPPDRSVQPRMCAACCFSKRACVANLSIINGLVGRLKIVVKVNLDKIGYKLHLLV